MNKVGFILNDLKRQRNNLIDSTCKDYLQVQYDNKLAWMRCRGVIKENLITRRVGNYSEIPNSLGGRKTVLLKWHCDHRIKGQLLRNI